MNKHKYIEFTGSITMPARYYFDETDFNWMVKKYGITGITYDELIQIAEGKLPDRPIQLGDNLFDANGYPRYAYDFVIEAIQAKYYEDPHSWETEDSEVFIDEGSVRID